MMTERKKFYPKIGSQTGQIIDLRGKKFGRLTVLDLGRERRKCDGGVKWVCRCKCGNHKTVSAVDLKNGRVKSCKCLTRELVTKRNRTHGMTKTRIYNTWASMLQRCNNPNNLDYEGYGARGIKVCRRWMKFENFVKDMGERPTGKSLDRIDNSKGYSPRNCKWSDNKEQARNRRSNKYMTYDGQTKSLPEWAELYGISQRCLHRRLKRGLSPYEALTRKVKGKHE